jgi:two-component system, LytTR family, sensor kinase
MKQSAYRVFFKVLIAFAIALLFKFIFAPPTGLFGADLILITVVILILWEGNTLIDKWLNTMYSWIKSPQKRVVAQAVSFTLFTSLILFLLMFTLHQMRISDGPLEDRRGPGLNEVFIPALLFALALIAIYISVNFFNAWKNSLLEVEKYKTRHTEAQLQNLKNQLNPHFLFNNLSVLTSLIYQNQEKAADFVNELSRVYRYVLDNKDTELISLKEELDFLDHYIYLLKIRFGKAVSFSVNIEEKYMRNYLPPMCLQMLVENTIQHNEASQANPLQVAVYTKDDAVVVENNIQPRSDKAESTRSGLANIQSRYTYYTDKKVGISGEGAVFKVTLPLMLNE